MDEIDVKILNCLKANARQRASSISQMINLSVSAVTERIKKLEKSGIIKQYTLLLNQARLGNDMMAFIEVSLSSPQYEENFLEAVKNNANIISCYSIAGNFDYLLQTIAYSNEKLEDIHREIKGITGVNYTCTHFVLSNKKCECCMIPDADTFN